MAETNRHPRHLHPATDVGAAAATPGRIVAPVAVATLAIALLACAAEGRPYACGCTYLTDFDDGSKADVEVCAPSAERAPAVARGCAQSGAPAPVQACSCAPVPSGPPCKAGACAIR